MTVKIVSIDSIGNEREVGTASDASIVYETFPDMEIEIKLHDFSGTPDTSLYAGIYRDLRAENTELRQEVERLKGIDSSVVQEYEERIERLIIRADAESSGRKRWMKWHEDDCRELREQRDTLREQLNEAQDAIAKLLDGFNEGFEAMDTAAAEWNAFVDAEVPA